MLALPAANANDADARKAEDLRTRKERGEPLFRSQQEWLEAYDASKATKDEPQEANAGAKRFEPGWKETKWSQPCREFTLTGKYIGPDWSFSPDEKQSDEKGTFWPFKFYKFKDNLKELKEARKAPSDDPAHYQDKQLKISFMGSASHPGSDKAVHRFKLIWLTSIEVLE